MRVHTLSYQLYRCIAFMLMCVLLISCAIRSTTPISAPPQSTTVSAPVSTNEPAAVAPPHASDQIQPNIQAASAWTVGLLDEPTNILPFSPDGRAAAPLVQALFPAPVLGLSYTYTTTGILTTLPTLANGDVQVQNVSGFVDSTGQFTTTETTQPTTTQQLAITYRWNPELRWADGEPVTAADSVFAYDLFGQVQAPQEAQVTRDLIERYEQVDAHTTRAVLTPGRIDPGYLQTAWPPLPQHHLKELRPEDALTQFKDQPLGYGPFTFQDQQPGESIVLARNEYWPHKERLPEQLIFRFFANADDLRSAIVGGAVDVGAFERVPQELYRFLDQDQHSGTTRVMYLNGPVYEHLDFNLADERWQDVRVRRALAHAINRQGISDALFGGKAQALNSWILPEQRSFYAGDEQLTRYNYDPNKARALLDEAGLTDKNGDGTRELANNQPFSVTLLTTETPLRQALAQRLADDLKAVGIQVEPEFQPTDQLYSPTGPLYRRTFQLALFGWIASVEPGGVPLWSCNAVPTQDNGYTGNNFGGWCYEAAEWPLRRANNSLDQRVRARDYLTQQQAWSQEVPMIPLLQRPIAVVSRSEIRGIVPDSLAPLTWNVEQWNSVRIKN